MYVDVWRLSEFAALSGAWCRANFAQANSDLNCPFFYSPCRRCFEAKFWQHFYEQHLLCFLQSVCHFSPSPGFSLFYFPSQTLIFGPACFLTSVSFFLLLVFLSHSTLSSSCSSAASPRLPPPPPPPTNFHTPLVRQQRLFTGVFTAPISLQRANLPQSAQQYSPVALCVCVCVGWKHTCCLWLLSKLDIDWAADAGTATPSAVKGHFMVGLESYCVCVIFEFFGALSS